MFRSGTPNFRIKTEMTNETVIRFFINDYFILDKQLDIQRASLIFIKRRGKRDVSKMKTSLELGILKKEVYHSRWPKK